MESMLSHPVHPPGVIACGFSPLLLYAVATYVPLSFPAPALGVSRLPKVSRPSVSRRRPLLRLMRRPTRKMTIGKEASLNQRPFYLNQYTIFRPPDKLHERDKQRKGSMINISEHAESRAGKGNRFLDTNQWSPRQAKSLPMAG